MKTSVLVLSSQPDQSQLLTSRGFCPIRKENFTFSEEERKKDDIEFFFSICPSHDFMKLPSRTLKNIYVCHIHFNDLVRYKKSVVPSWKYEPIYYSRSCSV